MPRTRTPPRKKQTTTRAFLFSDLRDYTSYVEAKGDAAAARLLREYRTLVRREVARYEGAEVKTEGDSFYVVFESASGALDCAVAILRAADAQTMRDPAVPLRIGVGLHAGETVEYDDQFVGSAVNIASRLAGKAGAMELLISDTLRGLVRTSQSLPMSDRGPLELKGVAERIRAWNVDWREPEPATRSAPQAIASAPAPAPATGQLLCPIVVGRGAEIERFEAALAAAIDGAGQTVVVGGEAGVGKTKLAREAQNRAVAKGARVLLGLTHQSDAGLPYAPFVSAIRSGFHGLDRDELGRVLQRSAPDLAELFPELGRIGGTSTPTGLERHRLTVAFQHLFRAFARETPVLVVLEDLHWADETSLELLQHLARELRDARVLIYASYRSDEMHRRHPFLRTLAELQRERVVTEIQLKRLSPDETGELIRATFATREATVRISDEFRDALHARSDGNPFFTEELLKALVDSGGVYWKEGEGWQRKPIDQLEIPGSIREAVRARVEELTPEGRETLSAAAVFGLRFPFEALRTVRGLDDQVLETQLRQLIDEQLVVEVEDGRDEFAFRHALTREVVYDDLLVRERKRLHRRVADVLAEDETTEPAVLANHLIAAGEPQLALPRLVEAGDRAARTSAPREAAALYAKAIEIGLPDEQLASVIERQADAYHSFDTALAVKAAKEAEALYRQLGDAPGRSRMMRLEARGHFYQGHTDLAERRTQDAIDVLEGREAPELARATAQLAGHLMTRQAMAEALPIAERAIELAERLNDPWALANALITKGSALRGETGLPDLRRGLEVALRHGVHEAAQRAYNNTAIAHILAGAPAAERRRIVEDGLAHSRRYGIEGATTMYLLSAKMALDVGQGRWDEALATGDRMLPALSISRWGDVYRGHITLARGGPDAALAHYRILAEEARSADARHDRTSAIVTGIFAAEGLAHAGRIDEARSFLAIAKRHLDAYPAGATDLDTPRSNVAGPGLLPVLGVAVLLADDEWIGIAEAEIRSGVALGHSARLLVDATRAVRAGDLDRAAPLLEESFTDYERIGFEAFWYRLAIILIGTQAPGALGQRWRPMAERIREFASRTGARAWLEALDRAGL
jgi:class 3 adenylate cyclase/tetratricopeptide (TPR) repeat protein/type II secretory pathway predicted ATPase ExeA